MNFLLLFVFTIALLLIALVLFGVKILFHKTHRFPETSAGHSKEMRKRGIGCPRHEETKLWADKRSTPNCSTCYEHSRE